MALLPSCTYEGKKTIKFIYNPNCTLWAEWRELVTENHSSECIFHCRIYPQCWRSTSARGRRLFLTQKVKCSLYPCAALVGRVGKRRTKNTPLEITIFTAAFMWNNRFITRCSCHLCRLLSNLSFYRLFCCWIICQVRLQVSGVQIIITAVFLFLSFCLTGDWFCQFHRLHVPWNMPRPFYLLPFSADAVLEQETLQQGVYRNSWWVHLNVCPSIPLSWPRRVLIWQDLEYQCC